MVEAVCANLTACVLCPCCVWRVRTGPRPSDGGAKGEGQDGATGSGMANAMAQLLGTRLSAAKVR